MPVLYSYVLSHGTIPHFLGAIFLFQIEKSRSACIPLVQTMTVDVSRSLAVCPLGAFILILSSTQVQGYHSFNRLVSQPGTHPSLHYSLFKFHGTADHVGER